MYSWYYAVCRIMHMYTYLYTVYASIETLPILLVLSMFFTGISVISPRLDD